VFLKLDCNEDSKVSWDYFAPSCVFTTLCSVEYGMLKSSCACYLQLLVGKGCTNNQDPRGQLDRNDIKEVIAPKID